MTKYEIKQKTLQSAIKKMPFRNDNHEIEYWKFNRIFNDGTKEEIESIIYSFYNRIKSLRDLNLQSDDTCIVGLYKSGALLAHCINICSNRFGLVGLFTTFPSVGIHPRSVDIRDNYSQFVVVDESFKSGFTAEVACEYINRNDKLNTFKVLSLSKFNDFNKLGELEPSAYIMEIDSIGNKDKEPAVSRLQNNHNNELLSLESFIAYLEEDISGIKRYEIYSKPEKLKQLCSINVFENLEYDITRLLSDSIILFSIGLSLLKKINFNTKDKIYINSPSDEGRLLAEVISLIFKIKEKEKDKDFLFNRADFNTISSTDTIQLFIDISMDTGITKQESNIKDVDDPDIIYDQQLLIFKNKKIKDKSIVSLVEY